MNKSIKKRFARLNRNLPYLNGIKKSSKNLQKKIIKNGKPDLIKCLCDICHNIVQGKIYLTPKEKNRAIKHRQIIRKLADKRNSIVQKRKQILQTGGFLSAIIGPAIALATTLIAELTARK